MSKKVHVLVVDDEPDIRESFEEYLELQGYRVTCADGSAAARRVVASEPVDVALLDVSMPGEDGLSLARYLREHTDLAIIIIASAGDVIDRTIGLEVGADDYLAKPVNLRELGARVLAVLRWKRGEREAAARARAGGDARYVAFGHCRLDIDAQRLIGTGGEDIAISAMDYRMLKVLADNPCRVLSRDRLFSLTRGRDWDPTGRSVDIQIVRLRRKIEADARRPRYIKTVHGAGYVFSPLGE